MGQEAQPEDEGPQPHERRVNDHPAAPTPKDGEYAPQLDQPKEAGGRDPQDSAKGQGGDDVYSQPPPAHRLPGLGSQPDEHVDAEQHGHSPIPGRGQWLYPGSKHDSQRDGEAVMSATSVISHDHDPRIPTYMIHLGG